MARLRCSSTFVIDQSLVVSANDLGIQKGLSMSPNPVLSKERGRP